MTTILQECRYWTTGLLILMMLRWCWTALPEIMSMMRMAKSWQITYLRTYRIWSWSALSCLNIRETRKLYLVSTSIHQILQDRLLLRAHLLTYRVHHLRDTSERTIKLVLKMALQWQPVEPHLKHIRWGKIRLRQMCLPLRLTLHHLKDVITWS